MLQKMTFIHEDFLLQTVTAQRLYHEFAENEPILDYHTHLPPADVANNRRFADLSEIWLEGDHYKWRALRASGVPENLCTGDGSAYDKFLAWASTVPKTLRNPLYHWTHLELKRYFDVDELLSEKTAPQIWEQANACLQSEELSAHGILAGFNVRCVCTTDDPTDDLSLHAKIAASNLQTKIYPTFRPDAAFRIHETSEFIAWLNKLQEVSNVDVDSYDNLLAALKQRHDAFHEIGCRLSDHGLESCYSDFCSDETAATIFDQARSGQPVSPQQLAQYASNLMLHFGIWDSDKGWTKQLHLGAIRNNSPRLLAELGRDVGCDSIGDWLQAQALSAYLGCLDEMGALPQTILYNVNPTDNYVFAAMAGNFQSGGRAGKLQFGSGWWFLDTDEGMRWQLNTLSNLGLLSQFIGMLTDSRSFMSYPRHEYFRRCLCDLLGGEIEKGILPNDIDLIGEMVRNICFSNAHKYLGLEM
ncbi:MAG: glucuronate isomerase [Pirellulales bacterium]|nr:glucuronate isomerase [Pirellulales bacterium]